MGPWILSWAVSSVFQTQSNFKLSNITSLVSTVAVWSPGNSRLPLNCKKVSVTTKTMLNSLWEEVFLPAGRAAGACSNGPAPQLRLWDGRGEAPHLQAPRCSPEHTTQLYGGISHLPGRGLPGRQRLCPGSIRRASFVLGCSLDSAEEVGDRRMVAKRSPAPLGCAKGRSHRSSLHTAARLYRRHIW